MLASSGCSEPISLSCPPGSGDVIVVDNPFEGRWSTDGEAPRLTEEWRIGLPEGVGSPRPEAVGIGADGTVIIVELGTGAIIELDPEGDDAPSEEALPADVVAALTDAVLDERLPAPAIDILPSTGFLVALPPQPILGGADERRVSFVVRMAADASITDTLYAVSVTMLNDHGFVEWPRPGTGMPLVADGPGGEVALAGASSAYRIDVLRADFTDSLVVCRQAPALPLTESETGEIELLGSPPGLAWLLDASRRVKTPLPFGRIFLGSEGRLWVQRERPDPQRVYAHPGGAAYDVFAIGGEYLGEVRAPARVVLVGEAADLVYGLEGSGQGRASLVAFGLR
jgi:hypothetical protein